MSEIDLDEGTSDSTEEALPPAIAGTPAEGEGEGGGEGGDPKDGAADGASTSEDGKAAEDKSKTSSADGGEAGSKEPSPDDDVIELHRTLRETTRERDTSVAELQTLRQEVESLRPMKQLIALYDEDPAQFLHEVADLVDMDPERIVQIIADKKTGGDGKLTTDDQIARLKAEIESLKNPKPKEDKAAEGEDKNAEIRQGYLDSLQAHIDAQTHMYPLSKEDPDAAAAALEVMVDDWRQNHEKPGWKEMEHSVALGKVEQVLREREVARLEKLGYKVERPAPPAGETPKKAEPAPQQSKAAPAATPGTGGNDGKDSVARVTHFDLDDEDDDDPLPSDAEIAKRLNESMGA